MYSRTQNENGTSNSRCLHCLMTIASGKSGATLKRSEQRHMCVEKALFELLAKSGALAAPKDAAQAVLFR